MPLVYGCCAILIYLKFLSLFNASSTESFDNEGSYSFTVMPSFIAMLDNIDIPWVPIMMQ